MAVVAPFCSAYLYTKYVRFLLTKIYISIINVKQLVVLVPV